MSIQSPARKHRSQMTNHIQTRAGTLLLSFLMTLAGPLCAQETQPDGPLEIRVRLDKTEALVADRVELELTVVAPRESRCDSRIPENNSADWRLWMCGTCRICRTVPVACGCDAMDWKA